MMKSSKTAAEWLDIATRYDSEGPVSAKKTEMALNAAIRADDAEHMEDPKTASLPRVAQ